MKSSQASTSVVDENARFRLLVESITDYAIYMLDPEGVVTSWNPGARRFKGYEASEILGSHFSNFYTEEDRAAGAPARALARAAAENRYEAEGWRVRKDGTRFWAHVLIDPIRAPDGALIGFAKITRDLTERREAEEALRRSQEQFRLLVQGVTDYAIYMLSPDGRVTSWNAGAERIKGYAAEEILGEHFSRFYLAEDAAAGAPGQALAVAAQAGRFEKEGWRLRKTGQRFWAHVIIDPIRDEGGTIIGFAKITRDITERHEAQKALDQARDALAQSQKMDAIGQLTGGVAHDFNNLLMAVLGSLELLRKRLDPADARAHGLLENAVLGAQRGASLTQRMLAFARRQELQLEAVDACEVVARAAELLTTQLPGDVVLKTDCPRGLPPVRSDDVQLEAALLNLGLNARDAMPRGGTLTITVVAESMDEVGPQALPHGDYLRLSVSDTGQGMDAQTVARATEPFFTTKGVGKGTGLGLSMVHGLAAQSGGRLEIDSRPGEGATLSLLLPVTVWPEVAHAPRGRAGPGRGRSLRVLVVDDDPLVLANIEAMLDDLGHRPLAADSATVALDRLNTGSVDVVITDYAMPGMNGLDLARRLTAARPGLKVILATGFAELEGQTTTGLGRLAKPFSQRDLAESLRDVLAVS